MGTRVTKIKGEQLKHSMEQSKNYSNSTNTNGMSLDEFCDCLSKCIDYIGFSQNMITFRRDANANFDQIQNKKGYSAYNVTAGGKGEGTALYFESDIDRLCVVKGVECTESGKGSSPMLFQLEKQNCSPGYIRLRYVQSGSAEHDDLRKYLVRTNGITYIRNNCTLLSPKHAMIDIFGDKIKLREKKGPAASYGNSFIKYDFVFGFECSCPELIEKWLGRPRKYNWPNSAILEQISALKGHVVPVANKGSRFSTMEWRICFTRAELFLMHSLNESQTKAYIILKHFARSNLKPYCSAMTSYIMKNILFWILEKTNSDTITQTYLTEMFTDSLNFLKESLLSNFLPSYMIEDRNLLQGRITKRERKKLICRVNECIKEKQNAVLQCPKLHFAFEKMKASPESFFIESQKRDNIEILLLKMNKIFKESDEPGMNVAQLKDILKHNEKYMQYEEELQSLILPDNIRGSIDKVFKERLYEMLS